ncbi:phosphopantetheine-binding protein [Streptomyces sp. NPDC007856]|uniref:phosphopantetheine-binding protein n=1 Tax=Streptomyces sp. NPDC007856 TaxID=3364781 RepID=UPI0036A92A89
MNNDSRSGSSSAAVTELVAIWREVLQDDSLDASSHFEPNGGTSLKAVRIRARIRKRLNKDVSLLEIFSQSTPKALAAALNSAPDWSDEE